MSVASTPGRPAPAKYVPAVGPRLKILLWIVFGIVALLGANSLYMASVTALNWWTGRTYENWFSLWMALIHVALGLVLVVPFLAFGLTHLLTARKRKNKRAIRVGYGLFAISLVVLVSGFLLMRLDFGPAGGEGSSLVIKDPTARSAIYWAHVIAPLACVWLYWLHRLVGQKIRWKLGIGYLGAVAVFVGAMIFLHNQDPRKWNQVGSKDGDKYFFPSLSKTSDGKFIPAHLLDNNDYCLKCHQDVYDGWFHSAHHFSSFNNPAYLASVRETREVMLKSDGNVKGARWCAGCHDPVPFFSGAFDDPQFDDVRHPTAQSGITCTVCHAITHVNSTRGNADYTIEQPQHYPFATSDNEVLQWMNNQLIKAKPEFHKKTFLKDFHKTAEFCSTCHKVHLPFELNKYKEFLRGQNHYDTYLLSGVSGHGARSFYYPPKAQHNCNGCHMPLQASHDFGAKLFADARQPSIHDHLFPAANTGIAWLKDSPKALEAHQEFLKGTMRVDIFGVKDGGAIDGQLHAPLRPDVPALEPGKTYLLETVIRTLKLGHPFTQGTVDSNEVWLDVTVKSGDRIIGRNGGIDDATQVDPWSHFVNLFMLDKNGNRIDRRNPQDIFVPLYNHQIPPGAGQTVHYELPIPDDVAEPIAVELKLQYRKFDKIYTDFFTSKAKPGDLPIRGYEPGRPYRNALPIVTLAADRVVFPIAGGTAEVQNPKVDFPEWQRWNDYGIGLFLKGQGKAEPRQAEEAFQHVEQLGRYDGPLNLARVYHAEGRLDDAVAALSRAGQFTDPAAPPWTLAWLSGLVNREQGRLAEAEQNLRSVLYDQTPERQARGFDFSLDYEVINLLGLTLFDRARQIRDPDLKPERDALLRDVVAKFHDTLEIDSEDVTAHYQLMLLYKELGEPENAEKHRALHARYKTDDNARDLAVGLARKKYPAADHAAEAVVIYSLTRPGAPGLPQVSPRAVTRREGKDQP
jgi:tetratricopeptide (TPR) repeat protein